MAKKPRSLPGPYLLHLDMLPERIPDRNEYPFNLPAIRSLSRLPFHPKVTFFVGENGSGKSTLLEAIAVESGLNAEGGSANFRFSTYDSHSNLDRAIRLAKTHCTPADRYFLRAESYYNVASDIERLDKDPGGGPPIISYYGGVSLHEQSHGESFFALFQHRFRGNGLYFMDEPEAALSPRRQVQFLALLNDYVQDGCQFVIATHSPIIMAYPESTIYRLDSTGIQPVAYTETEHYLVTRGFLKNPAAIMADLFEPSEKRSE